MTPEDIFKKRNGLFCYDVEDYALNQIEEKMASLEGLRQLGFTIEESVEYTFVNEHDEQLIQSYPITDYITYEEYVAYYGEDYLEKIEEIERPFVSYEINSEDSLAILYLDMCRYNDEYKKTVKEMFVQVKALGIKNIAVDLRNNPGGSSMVVNEFIRYLNVDEYMVDTSSWRFGPLICKQKKDRHENQRYEQYTFNGNLFLLTSVGTFSSAMMFAQYIGDNDLGVLIGETPANAANGYGEVVRFELPNSKLKLSVSSKEFTRANSTIPSDVVEVDVACGSKECMDVLYSYIGKAK